MLDDKLLKKYEDWEKYNYSELDYMHKIPMNSKYIIWYFPKTKKILFISEMRFEKLHYFFKDVYCNQDLQNTSNDRYVVKVATEKEVYVELLNLQ